MLSRVEKTTSTVVSTEFPAVERARSVSQMTQCSSKFALPSGYAANEVKKRMLMVLVAFPPVGGLAESRPASQRVVAVRHTTGDVFYSLGTSIFCPPGNIYVDNTGTESRRGRVWVECSVS